MYGTMTERRPTPAQLKRRLERLSAEYQAAKAKFAEVGFTGEGSLIERYTTRNNPNCRCPDPEQRHGPYRQLSCKHAGTTVSRVLSAEDAARYQEWIANRRRLDATLKGMNDLSRQAGEYILAGQRRPFHGPEPPAQPARTTQNPGISPNTWTSPGFARLRDRRSGPKTTCYQALPTRPEVATPKSERTADARVGKRPANGHI